MKIIKHWFTARNGIDWSLTKIVGTLAALAMIYNFVWHASEDFNGFGLGIAGMMAALAIKYAVEDKEEK